MNQLNTFKFIEKSKIKFGEKYNYSKSIYINRDSNITIICPEHGEFITSSKNHLSSDTGCFLCGRKLSNDKSKNDIKDFIKKANLLHNNKYKYDKSNYITDKTKIVITCPIHGDFQQTPNNHLRNKNGCYKCYKESMISYHKKDIYIIKFKEEHGL